MTPNEALALAESLARYRKDPLKFVHFAYPWGEGSLKDRRIEDWQAKLLAEIRDGLKTPNQVIREAGRSGHGVGKSALVSWLIEWGISTFPDARGIVTANTDTQLKTKTWPELAKWHSLFIAKDLFEVTATAIHSKAQGHEKTWRIDAVPWSATNTEAFAGLHNQGKRILLIFDEASGIDDKVWEVAEGALTDKDTEIIWCVFGNPTRRSGMFFKIFNVFRQWWNRHQVDSRTVSFTNKEELAKKIEINGIDSDFVRVRILGLEPKQAELQFISQDLVDAARGKHLAPSQYNFAPVILGVDPAWTGSDDFVIVKRQGLASWILAKVPKNDNDMEMAGLVAQLEDEHKADAVFIDAGYGTGIASAGKQMGRDWPLVWFNGKSTDIGCANKRMEMWHLIKQWLKDGGALPDDDTICSDLVGPQAWPAVVGPHAGKLVLESKDDMKERGLASPNCGDALGLTLAFPVKKKQHSPAVAAAKRDYDPLSDFAPATVKRAEYDPLKF